MSTDPDTYSLPSDPRANACGAFFDALKAQRGKAIKIDASAVERMDTLVAQVMLLGAKTWAADEEDFHVLNPSETVTSALTKLGLSDAIPTEETADVD